MFYMVHGELIIGKFCYTFVFIIVISPGRAVQLRSDSLDFEG